MFLSLVTIGFGQDDEADQKKVNAIIDSIENTIKYQKGTITLEEGKAIIKVPEGFKFIDAVQSKKVLVDYWDNPPDQASGVLGMLLPDKNGVLGQDDWSFIITYDDMGYVSDSDADDIDYDEMEQEIKKESVAENAERVKQGYEPIQFIGWAEKPHYDSNKKVLYWAKELKFGDAESNTLNYNVRILGRKGVFMFNAVSMIDKLPEVNKNLAKVIGSVTFDEGFKYADFNPDADQVAKWTIGGLVAGKVLAKVGFFAVILKFWKIAAVAIASFFGFKKKKKKQKENITFVEDKDKNNDV